MTVNNERQIMPNFILALRSFSPMVAFAVISIVAASAQAQSQQGGFVESEEGSSRHEGYYYPPLTSSEVYPARAETMPDTSKSRRLGFIVGVTKGQTAREYPPTYAMYAKGADAEKMIIVSLYQDFIVNLYQARALLAQMTAVSRDLPLFVENRVEDYYTFLDLLKLLGFTELTITNGLTYSHKYEIE